MGQSMECILCKQRGGKRYCLAVRGYICTLCCGAEREVSIDCPFECTYLQEAYRNEEQRAKPPEKPAYAEHDVPEGFVEEHNELIARLAVTLLESAREGSGIRDDDLRAVLDALIRTYQTLSSGLVYETLPDGAMRVEIYRKIQALVQEWRRRESQATGIATLRDGDVFRALVFLGRVAQLHCNRRPRGKSFLAFLRRAFPAAVARQQQNVIVPGQ
jgi:hypothetical protein